MLAPGDDRRAQKRILSEKTNYDNELFSVWGRYGGNVS